MPARYFTALLLVGALGFSAALASTKQEQEQEQQSTESILNSITELRESLEDGDPRTLSRQEWREFNRIDSRFQALLTGVDDVHALHHDRKIEIFNLQEQLGELLVEGSLDNRIVCTRTARTGSRIPRRDCATQGELNREKQQTRELLDRLGPQFGAGRLGSAGRGGNDQ